MVVEKPGQPRRRLVAVVEDCVFLPIEHAVVGTLLSRAVAATSINQLPLACVDSRQQASEYDGAREAIETMSVSGNDDFGHAVPCLAHGPSQASRYCLGELLVVAKWIPGKFRMPHSRRLALEAPENDTRLEPSELAVAPRGGVERET